MTEHRRERVIYRLLQNSLLTRWVWRYWQHEETGRITILPFWRNPGKRWYQANWKD